MHKELFWLMYFFGWHSDKNMASMITNLSLFSQVIANLVLFTIVIFTYSQ